MSRSRYTLELPEEAREPLNQLARAKGYRSPKAMIVSIVEGEIRLVADFSNDREVLARVNAINALLNLGLIEDASLLAEELMASPFVGISTKELLKSAIARTALTVVKCKDCYIDAVSPQDKPTETQDESQLNTGETE